MALRNMAKKSVKKKIKKLLLTKVLLIVVPLLLTLFFIMVVIMFIVSATSANVSAGCGSEDVVTNTDGTEAKANSTESPSSAYASVEAFINEHKEAYIESWKAGGFLPSASITQTMIENGFNFTNPNGTSFWQAHNMGGVKTSKKSDFPVTIAKYGEDSVDLTGSKPGANVGDGTGGAYAWFSSYDAGIVAKAEFMAHQTLYTGAINNTDGISTLSAIADGGWATDTSYKSKLIAAYNNFGRQYEWLDKEAIAKYGNSPYKQTASASQDSKNSGNSDSKKKKSDLPDGVSTTAWELVLVNRDNKKEEMNPSLATVENIQVDARIKDATVQFLAKAREINPSFHLISGYRSVETQRGLYDRYVRQEMAERGISYEEAEKFTQEYSQPAGSSEHQTGLAIDISTVDALNQMSPTDGAALDKIAADYGFIRHFKEEYKSSTGIGNEDWHFRYVGKASAKYITEKNISFEDYIKKLNEEGATSSDEAENNCADDDSSSSGKADGTGTVPTDATAWGYKPDEVPDSLKQYIIDPKSLGMEYAASTGWNVTGTLLLDGQCVNLTVSMANKIWGHTGGVSGNGKDMANAWAAIFGNGVKNSPKKGAIFATQNGGGGNGHTGIVCHVFENGSILIVEQNTPMSGWDLFHQPYTWNYRIWTPEQQKAEITTYAYPDDKQPNFKGKL